jgi:PKD repeat protein
MRPFLFFFYCFCVFSLPLSAQTSTISGVINRYATVLNYDSCAGRINVSDTTGFRAGNDILIMQMQGATIATGNNFLYGVVTNMNFAGRYERAEIVNVTAGAIFVKNRPVYSLFIDGNVQIVSIPKYNNAVVTDTIKPLAWNGIVGGVVAMEVTETLTLNAPIVADGMGFRGAQAVVAPNNGCTWLVPEIGYIYTAPNWRGAPKGEGIASNNASGNELGRGPYSTGGGGGNDHNAGGGGGANTVNGGTGGDNDEPSTFGCDGYYPGIGGYAPISTTNRMFLGGGGGAGHTNNQAIGSGANGGGIIFIEANQIIGANPKISANGANAVASTADGAGGGGAGGTIWLRANQVNSGLIVRTNGGRGGNSGSSGNRCLGPGGGGAGGRILTNVTTGSLQAQGGLAGVVTLSSNGCNGSNSGADNGENGQIQTLPTMIEGTVSNQLPAVTLQPLDNTVCPNDSAVFVLSYSGGADKLQWQFSTNGATWVDILGATDSILTITNVSDNQNGWQYRCVLEVTGCYQTTTIPADLIVAEETIGAFTIVPQSYNVFDFNNLTTGDTTAIYSWDFGDGTTSDLISATHTYTSEDTFQVTLTIQTACGASSVAQSIVVLFPPVANFLAPDSVFICGPQSIIFENNSTGTAVNYQWFFEGGTPQSSSMNSPEVTYSATGNYDVTLIIQNPAGSDTLVRNIAIIQIPPPSASIDFQLLGNNAVQFESNLNNANGVLWDFGDNNNSTEIDPIHSYSAEGVYTITLTYWNSCDTISIETEIILLAAPFADFFVQDTVFGCGLANVFFANSSTGQQTTFSWDMDGAVPPFSTDTFPSVTYSNSGTYTVTLTVTNVVGSSTATRTFYVQNIEFPEASFAFVDQPNGPTVQFENTSTGSNTIIWNFGDPASGTNNTSTLQNPTHKFTAQGIYTITIQVQNICGISILQQQIEVNSDGVFTHTPVTKSQVRLYPNPARDYFTIEIENNPTISPTILIHNSIGQFIVEEKMSADMTTIVTADWPAGVYFCTLKWPDRALSFRVVIEQE